MLRVVLLVLAGWLVLSVLITVIYAIGARTGYRRGFEDGYEAATSPRATEEQRRRESS